MLLGFNAARGRALTHREGAFELVCSNDPQVIHAPLLVEARRYRDAQTDCNEIVEYDCASAPALVLDLPRQLRQQYLMLNARLFAPVIARGATLRQLAPALAQMRSTWDLLAVSRRLDACAGPYADAIGRWRQRAEGRA